MTTSSLEKNNPGQIWQTYLQKIHQEDAMEPDIAASRKFWKNYEALIQQNKKSRSQPQSELAVTPSSKDIYHDLFLKYWNGISSTIIYDQEVPTREVAQVSDASRSKELLKSVVTISGTGIFITALVDVLGLQTGGIVLSVLGVAAAILANRVSKNKKDNPLTKIIPGHTTHYTYQFNVDHLIFTQRDQTSIEKIIRLDYYKVKAFETQQGELRLESLYHHSPQDKAEAKNIKATFCIPVNMPQGKVITDFLREILQLNKTKKDN